MIKNYISIILLLFSSPVFSQNRTVGLIKYRDANLDGYLLFSTLGTKKTYLIDKCGRKIKEWSSSYNPGLAVALLPNGSLLRAGNIASSGFGAGVGGILERFGWGGALEWSYKLSDTNESFHHDFKVLPNGNILAIVWEKHSATDAISKGRDPATIKNSIWSERIEELKPLGMDSAQVVWQWRVWDHLVQDYDSSKPNYGSIYENRNRFDINFTNGQMNYGQDWFHFNSVDYNPELDQIMISSHSLDEFYIIDHGTTTFDASQHTGGKYGAGGDLLYRWGNPESYKMGDSTTRRIFHGHHATWVPKGQDHEGEILFFNNGWGRSPVEYSSVDVFAPPINSDGTYSFDSGRAFAPDTQVVIYKAPKSTDFYSMVMGGVFPIANNHYMVTNSTSGTIMEIVDDTNIIWQYKNPITPNGTTQQGKNPTAANWMFRAQFYYPDDSAFMGKVLIPGNELESQPYSKRLCEKELPPYYVISRINRQKKSGGISDSLGVKCRVSGTIQGINISATGTDVVIRDSSGSMRVFSPTKTFGWNLKQGDSIMVQGAVGQIQGWGSMVSLDTLIRLSESKLVRAAKVVKHMSEADESNLVQLKRVKLLSMFAWPASPLSTSESRQLGVFASDGKTDTVIIYGATDIDGIAAPAGYVDITGICGQMDSRAPYANGYVILPRRTGDIQPSSLPTVIFSRATDTAKAAGGYTIYFSVFPQDADFKFDLVSKGGTAIFQEDYFLSTKTVSVASGTSPSVSLTLDNPFNFTGYRDVVFAIRNIQGPANLGADSIFTLILGGKVNSVAEVLKKADVRVFPNPNSGAFRVISGQPVRTAQMLDATGKVVHEYTGNGREISINEGFKSGYYLLKLLCSDGSICTTRILVNN